MTPTKLLQLAAISIFGAGLPIFGYCQVYSLSTPINGYMTVSMWNSYGHLLPDEPSVASGNYCLNFTTLSEVVYLNATNQTIRQIGTISYTPSAQTISIVETQQIGQFPNPPRSVVGRITVTVSTIDGVLSFDNGPDPVTWDSEATAYRLLGSRGNIYTLGPFNGSYSLETEGQTYTGAFSYILTFQNWVHHTFYLFSLDNYPSSLSLSGLGDLGWPAIGIPPGGTPDGPPASIADVTASNGFRLRLAPGIYYRGADVGEQFNWGCPSVVATQIYTTPPAITAQPASTVTTAYSNVFLNVTATGTLPLSYQWSFNGTNISGATNSTLILSNIVPSQLGCYAVVITNLFGSTTSSNAVLSMYPFLATPFRGVVTYWGREAIFTVNAWGTGPLSYQWFKDGLPIMNATNRELSLTGVQFTNAGFYSIVVSSQLGSVTNAPAQVIVYPADISIGLYPGVIIDGTIGYRYVIQSTTNLCDSNSWVTLTNLTLTVPKELWVDTNSDALLPGNPRRFYQILPGQ